MLAVKHFKPPIESSAINCLFLVLFLSDNIPSDTLSGNESQHGIQSISEPHGPSDGFDAWAAAQHSPARPWESYRSGSHGKWHLRTKTCAHRQAGGMQQLLCFYVLRKNAERWMLIGAPTCPARFAENSSAGTAREVRTTAATLTPWRRAWWTATRTRSLSAWTILKAAAAETSASTSTLQLTCRPESRLHSTKPVKTPRPQAWWVVLDTVSLYFLTKISIKIFSCFSEEKHACKPTVKQANLCHTAKSIISWIWIQFLFCCSV